MTQNIRIVSVVLTLILIFFSIMIYRFYFSVDTALKKDEPETNTVNVFTGNLYSFRENGYYGVKESSGRIIIEAVWNEIRQLGYERFIVSRYTNNGIRYGIIDISANIVVPFIYTEISSSGSDFMIGITEDGGYVLFDSYGDIIIDEEWDTFSKKYETKPLDFSGNYIQLSKNGSIYRIRRAGENSFRMYNLILKKEILGKYCDVVISNYDNILSISTTYKVYNEITDDMLLYIEALFEGDSSIIKELSWNEDYRDLQFESKDFRGSELVYEGKIAPQVSENNGKIEYKCSAGLMYTSPGSIEWDGTYSNHENYINIEVLFKKKQDGTLGIYKAYVEKSDADGVGMPGENNENQLSSGFSGALSNYPDYKQSIQTTSILH